MSETERLKGKFSLVVNCDSEDELNLFCQHLFESEGVQLPKYYHGDYIEGVTDNNLGSNRFFRVKNSLWKIDEVSELQEFRTDISLVHGTQFQFKSVFYNGGTSLSETLSDAILKANILSGV